MAHSEQSIPPAVREMKTIWGGRLPTWKEFKEASKENRVRCNETVAAQAIYKRGIPKVYLILYGIVTIWSGFLIFPATLIAWFFMDFSAGWIVGSLFIAWFLVKVSREGHCEGMKCGAEENEKFYDILINSGAFLFDPKQ